MPARRLKSSRILCACFSLGCLVVLFMTADPCAALEPREVLVLANRKVADGLFLSKYYMTKRSIPEENIVLLDVADEEVLSREAYEKDVAEPVRRHLQDKDPFRFIRCLVTLYGLPLKVADQNSTDRHSQLKDLKDSKARLESEMEKAREKEPEKVETLRKELEEVKKKARTLQMADQRASLDSEIALVMERSYPVEGWVPNPHCVGYTKRQKKQFRRNALMVSRLDGPSSQIVRRIIDDSVATEDAGLRGTAYFDARWPQPAEEGVSGYRSYDK